MENSAISDGQITASSRWNADHDASVARLHLQTVPGKAGAWAAGANDGNQWLQIDLGDQFTKVTRVATQGRHAYGQWVTKYNLQHRTDGVNFQYYKDQGQTINKVHTYSSITKLNRAPLIAVVSMIVQLLYLNQNDLKRYF